MCKECFVDEIRVGEVIIDYCECGKYGKVEIHQHPEIGLIGLCVEGCKIKKDSEFKLCGCPDCDCQYVRNHCECNAKEHYMRAGQIHWILK